MTSAVGKKKAPEPVSILISYVDRGDRKHDKACPVLSLDISAPLGPVLVDT